VAIRFWRRAIEAEKEGVSLPAGQGLVDKADPSLSPRRQFLDFLFVTKLLTRNKQQTEKKNPSTYTKRIKKQIQKKKTTK